MAAEPVRTSMLMSGSLSVRDANGDDLVGSGALGGQRVTEELVAGGDGREDVAGGDVHRVEDREGGRGADRELVGALQQHGGAAGGVAAVGLAGRTGLGLGDAVQAGGGLTDAHR